jgi:hypothetical protein
MVLITEDPLAVSQLNQLVRRIRGRAARLQRDLAADQLAQIKQVQRALPDSTEPADQSSQGVAPAHALLKQCDAAMATGDDRQAFDYARQVLRYAGWHQQATWNAATRSLGHPTQFALLAAYATLPDAYRQFPRFQQAPPGGNLLTGGDMEQIGEMHAAGWRHVSLAGDRMRSRVELSADQPHSGRHSLYLHVSRGDASAPELVEAPTVWMTSPTVELRVGQVVRIQGWIRIPRPIQGTADGLLVLDSAGQQVLALRTIQTRGWQPFSAYRAVTQDGPFQLTIALAGIGDAWIDDVAIEPVDLPAWEARLDGPQPTSAADSRPR